MGKILLRTEHVDSAFDPVFKGLGILRVVWLDRHL
jgi:hypothetical protein